MLLTSAQLTTLKADIAANTNQVSYNGTPTAINALPNNSDTAVLIASWYNGASSPDYWVWRTLVGEHEFTQQTSQDGTTFNWTGAGYITRSQGERDAFREIFNSSLSVNPTLVNVRQAFADIFSGATAPAPANRTHLLTTARRKSTRIERLFVTTATGPGNDGVPANRGLTTNPDALGYEGPVSANDIEQARNLP